MVGWSEEINFVELCVQSASCGLENFGNTPSYCGANETVMTFDLLIYTHY